MKIPIKLALVSMDQEDVDLFIFHAPVNSLWKMHNEELGN